MVLTSSGECACSCDLEDVFILMFEHACCIVEGRAIGKSPEAEGRHQSCSMGSRGPRSVSPGYWLTCLKQARVVDARPSYRKWRRSSKCAAFAHDIKVSLFAVKNPYASTYLHSNYRQYIDLTCTVNTKKVRLPAMSDKISIGQLPVATLSHTGPP